MTERRDAGRILDSVRWDYDPEEEELSPLVSTERYFRDFPWEGLTTPDSSDLDSSDLGDTAEELEPGR